MTERGSFFCTLVHEARDEITCGYFKNAYDIYMCSLIELEVRLLMRQYLRAQWLLSEKRPTGHYVPCSS